MFSVHLLVCAVSFKLLVFSLTYKNLFVQVDKHKFALTRQLNEIIIIDFLIVGCRKGVNILIAFNIVML